jgi:carbon storage regulator
MEAQGALMLVLSRRLNQTIVIGGRVRVTVLAITANRVELGVEAPLQIAVDREEIHLRRLSAQPAVVGEPDSGKEKLSPGSPGSPGSEKHNSMFGKFYSGS